MKEIWKPIKDYENIYLISNYGTVKSLERININSLGVKTIYNPRNLNPSPNNRGYLTVQLTKLGKRKTFSIHRLVALTFIENPKNKKEVNHIDGIKTNNHINNLEWVSKSENGLHAYQIGLKKSKPVQQFTKTNILINEFKSISAANRFTEISYAGIWKCCNNKTKTSGNYIWKYM